MRGDEAGRGETVAELALSRWQAVLAGRGPARFAEPGWTYGEVVARPCPQCGGELHALRKPYESNGRGYQYTALVCPGCSAPFTLADLGVKRYDELAGGGKRRPAPVAVPFGTPPHGPCQEKPGATGTAVNAPAQPRRRKPESGPGTWPEDQPVAERRESRALWWCMTADPRWRPPEAALDAADDVRVILPEDPRYEELRGWLRARDVPCRVSPYWEETGLVSTVNDLGGRTELLVVGAPGSAPVAGPWAVAARDAFAAQWDALDELPRTDADGHVPVGELVPEEWAPLLPYPSFNPMQAVAVPVVLKDSAHLVVVAPTGAGKTPIGMVAALDAFARGRKAAWLVPQRSLTDELDRELAAWRRRGLRVVRLTGEAAVDTELIRSADVWVATTEKFEAICRAGSLRDALAEVACLVVDEIHLLGDPVRGAVLEALLSRVREDSSATRIVGLSATVANADEVAEWLGARILRTTWRPTRLTWQLPVLTPVDEADWQGRARVRTAAAVRIARQVTEDGGSVLVFCGSKRRVRSTALALAADRGVPTAGADADDAETVERLCSEAGVRIHYRDWPYKREAEQAFRAREAEVLVATSTVAAGVNLPARAVIVSDTTIGLDRIEVSMVQQMFGRAGRIGAGEREGWAFLLTDPSERPHWQARLAAGYTVRSRLADRLADHLLAEAVQQRLSTLDDAERWWNGTFAAHQGNDSVEPLRETARFLTTAGCLRPTGDTELLEPSALGQLTSRFMADTVLADELTTALGRLPVPEDPFTAEQLLTTVLGQRLPALEQAPFTDRARAALTRALRQIEREREGAHADDPWSLGTPPAPDEEETAPRPADFSRAVLLLTATRPHLFRGRPSYVLGIPVESMTGILEEAERYLAWLGAQGQLGTVHPWVAIVAGDLAKRIRWRSLEPARGAGRLLWMCEQMATPPSAPTLVPRLWHAARRRDITTPDWPGTTAPTDCALPPDRYRRLLTDRAGTSRLTLDVAAHTAVITAPPGTTVRLWNGTTATLHHTETEPTTLPLPPPWPDDASAGRTGAALFTRGDHRATGWLEAYGGIRP
ncbi:DEAD/DEAH box helicase [Streptomyces sp. BRB081]|uniref:DEAD/DEAH box helicase n=1 Tax=Streptomyces sp. BRB081 TaxID=2769544 RepID=UPI0018ACD67E|nr:DEAD/DEAH box helicase [Streptomyces sp. BRB081]MBL3805891.1 DEAD/DEAH box helicase [Streptomyces sp. BRB081]